jgi:hypothetical protein
MGDPDAPKSRGKVGPGGGKSRGEEGGKGIALLVEATPFLGEERNAGWGIERIRPRKPPLRLGRDCLRRNHWEGNRSEPTDDSREDSHHFRSTAMIETSVSDWGGTLNNRATDYAKTLQRSDCQPVSGRFINVNTLPRDMSWPWHDHSNGCRDRLPL